MKKVMRGKFGLAHVVQGVVKQIREEVKDRTVESLTWNQQRNKHMRRVYKTRPPFRTKCKPWGGRRKKVMGRHRRPVTTVLQKLQMKVSDKAKRRVKAANKGAKEVRKPDTGKGKEDEVVTFEHCWRCLLHS